MRQFSFRQRQFLTLLVLAIVPLAIMIGTVLPYSRGFIIRQTTMRLETVADLKTAQVQQWLSQGREVAHLVSSQREVREKLPGLLASTDTESYALAQADLYAEIGAISAIFPNVCSVSLLHPTNGQVLLSTDPTQEGRERRDENYFRGGQQALYVSPVAYSVGREAPVLIVSAPVQGESDELLAVVAVEMNLADLDATLNSRAGLGQTGRAYLVEAYGFYVTLPPEVEGSPLRTIAKSEGVRRAVAGQKGSDTYLDPRGVHVLGVYRWLPEVTLGLLVEMEEAELIGPVTRTWLLIILASLGLLVLAIIAARSLTYWLVNPLEQITEAARALQAGDLSHRAPPNGSDEIGQLATSFNEMADSLQRYSEDLEHLAEQRTAELQKANEQLQQEISERKRAEERLQRYAAELEQANEEVRQFAYIVSHDLRTPLINLSGFAAELRSGLEVTGSALKTALPHLDEGQRQALVTALQEDIPEALGFIHSSVIRMDRFINALLKLARLGRRELKLEPIDMGDLVQATLQTLAHQIEGRGVKVTVGSLPEVVADRTSIEQIMGNLLTNAVLYLDPDRPGEIEVTGERRGDETIFHVRDNGRGIAKEDMDKVFAPFRRVGRQDVPGEGMGLPYVQALVRRHGGRIWCKSQRGAGTTFTFTLPNHLPEGGDHA